MSFNLSTKVQLIKYKLCKMSLILKKKNIKIKFQMKIF